MTPDFIDPELGLSRVCASCGESWPLDREFFMLGGGHGVRGHGRHIGLRRTCRSCQNERTRARRLERMADPEFVERQRAHNRRYYLAHRETVCAKDKGRVRDGRRAA